MAISVRINKEEALLVKKYAEMKQMSVSELIRQTLMERIEDEYDLVAYHKAMAEFKKNPVTYTLDEVENALGLR